MRNYLALRLPFIIKLAILMSLSVSLFANAQGDIHDRWAKHSAESKKFVNHQAMTSILTFISVPQDTTKYNIAEINNRVLRYIREYKEFLESVPVSDLNKDEQLAFWLNLYNVSVIEKMGANINQTGRIKKLRGTPGNAGKWWADKNIEVEGVLVSLEDIEQNILARHWQNPLFIYGLFYGVNGDGFSSSVAFTGENVERQLKTMAKSFLNDKDNIKVKRGQARISSLLAWNKASVFGNSDEAILEHIREYANNKTSNKLAGVSKVSTKHSFSWRTAVYTPQPINRNAFGGGGAVSTGGGYRGGS